MSALVYQQMPATVGYGAIASAAPVRGVTWMPVADAVNYLLGGRPRSLIPHCGGRASIATNTTATLRYKVFPSYQATHRLWIVAISAAADDELPPSSVVFTDPSSGTSTWSSAGSLRDSRRSAYVHIETISARTASETALTVTIANGVTSPAAFLQSVACFEVTRPDLAIDTNDDGVEAYSFGGTNPIFDGAGYSLGALPEALEAARAMRRTLFQWAVPTADAIAITGTSVALFSYDPPLLDRFLYRSETTVEVDVRVYTRSSATTTGTIDIAMTTGDTVSIAVTANDTGTWRTGVININAEDLSTATGIRGSALDRATITATRSTGAGSVYVESMGIYGRST